MTSTGTIEVEGNVGETTTLDVNSAAGLGTAGAITGGVYLFGSASGPAILEFASASITSIGTAGTAGYLELDGPDAFVADAGSLASNSALTQLATVTAGSTLYLANGSSVTTNVALANSGRIYLDYDGLGGSSLTVVGALTNSNTIELGYEFGGSTQTKNDTLTATSLTNTGDIYLLGGGGNDDTVGGVITTSTGFTNSADVLVYNGKEVINSTVTGTGDFFFESFGNAATLQFDDSVGSGQELFYGGANPAAETLTLADPSGFAATIDNFGGSTATHTNVTTGLDFINLQGFVATSETVTAGDALQLTNAASSTVTLQLIGEHVHPGELRVQHDDVAGQHDHHERRLTSSRRASPPQGGEATTHLLRRCAYSRAVTDRNAR